MKTDVVRVEIFGVYPTDQQTLAVFIGTEEKCFIIHVDPNVGRAIALALREEKNERPLTHELIGYIFAAFSIKVNRVVINALQSSTYYARLILQAENEIHSKLIEIDARPSDCLVLALQAKAPFFVSQEIWDEAEDQSEYLEKIRQAIREKKSLPPEIDFGDEIT